MNCELQKAELLGCLIGNFNAHQAGISFQNPASLSITIVDRLEKRLNPSSLFDTRFYLRTYRDVLLADQNPLSHFLQWAALRAVFSIRERRLSLKPIAPSNEEWRRLSAARPSQLFPDSADVV